MAEWIRTIAAALIAVVMGYANFFSHMEKTDLRVQLNEQAIKEHIQDHRAETGRIENQLEDIQRDLNQLIGRQSR